MVMGFLDLVHLASVTISNSYLALLNLIGRYPYCFELDCSFLITITDIPGLLNLKYRISSIPKLK